MYHKKKKMVMIGVCLSLIISACGKNPTTDDRPSNIQTSEETKQEVPEPEPTVNDENTAYEEYLNSLRYLDEIEAKISNAVTTVDMVDATSAALEAWDIELNRIYALLIEKLSTEQVENLRTTQRLWIKERDQAAVQQAASFEGGSFYSAAYNEILLQWTKQRTLELVSVYFNDSDDFSFDLSLDSGLSEEKQNSPATKAVSFDVYDVNKKYYGENESYVELDLKLPQLEGDYDGIPAINTYFANKEQFFYEQLPLDMLEQLDNLKPIEGKSHGYFVSAYYYLETQIGDIISIPAIIDGGAGGVSWAAIEGNAFNLNTGEQIELSDLFRVSEEEYMGFIYDYVSREITEEMQAGEGGYFFQDAYAEDGAERIKSFNQGNFILSNDSLVVFYQKYELAAGAAGVRVFEIPYDLIKDILAMDSMRVLN